MADAPDRERSERFPTVAAESVAVDREICGGRCDKRGHA